MDEDDGRLALAELQAILLRARELASNGANPEVLFQESSEDLTGALYRLDLYLTDKTEGRRAEADEREFFQLFTTGRKFLVHLSDGGYSRLTLSFELGHPVVLDRGLSLEKPRKRWAELFPPV